MNIAMKYLLNEFLKLKYLVLSLLYITLCTLIHGCHLITPEKTTAEQITDLCHTWNKALVEQNLGALRPLYAREVMIYGRQKILEEVIQEKATYFSKRSTFIQKLGTVTVRQESPLQFRASFSKTSGTAEKASTVKAYLVFIKYGSKWLIAVEGDETTDKNLAKRRRR
jgi:hypothetical protein